MDTEIKRGRGRPKKVKLSDDEQFEEIFFKAYHFYFDKDGELKFERNHIPLTLEETSFLIWNMEGRKSKRPLSNMMILKTEQSALSKLRSGFVKAGIKDIDDILEPKYRSNATTYGSTEFPE